jgi:hypothetical protein
MDIVIIELDIQISRNGHGNHWIGLYKYDGMDLVFFEIESLLLKLLAGHGQHWIGHGLYIGYRLLKKTVLP